MMQLHAIAQESMSECGTHPKSIHIMTVIYQNKTFRKHTCWVMHIMHKRTYMYLTHAHSVGISSGGARQAEGL